jgi:Tol biopolymer transport system component
MIRDVATRSSVVVHTSRERLYEAPNWSGNGDLVLNADGCLWTVPTTGGTPRSVELTGLPALNNDHVLDPDGRHVFVSAEDGHIHRAPLAGGAARRVTADDGVLHFLHGISPDGKTLAYAGLIPDTEDTWCSGTVWTAPVDGHAPARQLTSAGPDDGPEFSPDGQWLYYNTESFSPGQAQIARLHVGSGQVEQLTFDGRVNWFPHLAPVGQLAYYVSFPAGTQGHPADLPVEVRVVDRSDWTTDLQTIRLPGGQGTANVNGWEPTGTRFAYVDYPMDEA